MDSSKRELGDEELGRGEVRTRMGQNRGWHVRVNVEMQIL